MKRIVRIAGYAALVVVLLLVKYTKGFIANISVLLGIIAGCALAISMGKMNFDKVGKAHWFDVVTPFAFGMPTFDIVMILTMTLVMMTAMGMTRERERGTLENLLATPVRPAEVMIGKIVPYVLIGYLQVLIVFTAARLLFEVPMFGNFILLSAAIVLFIIATLGVGFTFSTIARSQMQSMQMTMFFFLPNILLSGFMFPFRGMPRWAQWIGEALPLTHFLRIVRGVMLKGAGWADIAPQVVPILVFIAFATVVAMKRYQQTLD